MNQKKLGSTLAVGLAVLAMTSQAEAQTVTAISNPYSEFGVGELQSAKFVGVFTPDDGFNIDMFDLRISLGGVTAFGSSGRPKIEQAGYTGVLTGTTTINSAFVALWDGPALSFDNGSALGTNVILMQSSAASGDVFDMALVFDLNDVTPYPPTGEELTNVFFVCDPTSGSFTMDSAIAAAAGGPTAPHVPEPTSSALLALGSMTLLLRRRK